MPAPRRQLLWARRSWAELLVHGRLYAPLVLTRAQAGGARATALGADGVTWGEFGADEPRFNGTARRLLIGGQRTNGVRNPRGEFASAPTFPTITLPTNWVLALANGLTTNVVGEGVEEGRRYVDVRAFGVANSTSWGINFDAPTAIPAATGQTWTASFFARLVGGTLANVTSVQARITERTAAGASITSTDTPFALSAVAARAASTRTLADVTAGAVTCGILVRNAAIGDAIELTVRLSWPQLEQGAFVSSPILPPAGTLGASTRGQDTVTAPLSALGISATGACTILWSGLLQQPAPTGVSQAIMQIDDGSDNNLFAVYNRLGQNMYPRRVTGGVLSESGAGLDTMNAGATVARVGMTLGGAGTMSAYAIASGTALNLRSVTGGPISGLTTLRLGNIAAGTASLAGEAGYLRVRPFAVSDAELAARVAAFPV